MEHVGDKLAGTVPWGGSVFGAPDRPSKCATVRARDRGGSASRNFFLGRATGLAAGEERAILFLAPDSPDAAFPGGSLVNSTTTKHTTALVCF